MRLAVFIGLLVLCTPAQAHAFFFLIPLAAAGVAAAGAAATAGTVATVAAIGSAVLSAGAALAQGVAANKQAKNEARQLELNARLEGTAALQRDTARRRELHEAVGTIRAVRANVGVMSPTGQSFLLEARENIESDRLVEFANSSQRQADLRNQARSSRQQGRAALISGAVKAGLSLASSFSSFSPSAGASLGARGSAGSSF